MTPEQATRWRDKLVTDQSDDDVIAYRVAETIENGHPQIIAELFSYGEGEYIVRAVGPAGRNGRRQSATLSLQGSMLDAAIDEAELLLRDTGWSLVDAGVAPISAETLAA